MALDRENRSLAYVTGRMIAIAEHYAGNKFGPGTISAMFTHPAHGIDVWRRYIDMDDEYYQELEGIQLPVTIANEVDKGQAWIGYYHQKAAYGLCNDQERKRIGQRIADLRKKKGLTQQDVAERTGIQRNHISRIEAGRYSVGFDTLQGIAEALGGRIDIVVE